jgi:hypothetical protein
MRKTWLFLNVLLIATGLMIGGVSCKKTTETVTFSLSSIYAIIPGGSIDMNGATAPTNIPTSPNIVANFTVAVSAASVNSTTVTLTNTLDNSIVALNYAVSGAQITITTAALLGTGTPYQLKFNGVKSTDDQTIAGQTRNFTTEGPYAPTGAIAYWNFEGNANDQIGTFNPKSDGIVGITYASSFNTAAGKCAVFDGTTSIIEIPNGDQLSNTPDFSLCFWVKASSAGHVDGSGNPKGHFVMGLGAFYGFQFEIPGDYSSCKLAAQYGLADGTSASEDLWFPGDGKTGANGGWQGWTYCQDLTGSGGVAALLKDKWAFVVCVYDHASKVGTMYINGNKMKAQDFNLWPAGDPKTGVTGLKYGGHTPDVVNELAFGFIQSRGGTMWANETWGGYQYPTSNHFGGYLDEVRVYHRVLTEVEISAMYKP